MTKDNLKELTDIVDLLAYEKFYYEATLLSKFIKQAQADSAMMAHVEGKQKREREGEFWG